LSKVIQTTSDSEPNGSTAKTHSDFLESGAAGGAAVRGGTLRVIGYLVSAVAGAGSAAVLFRHLHASLTGLYVLASSIVAIVGGVSDLGMTTLGLRELANRDAAGRRELMRTLLGLRLFVTAVGIGAAVGFAAVAGYSSPVVAGVALAGVGLLFQNLQTTLSIDLMRKLRLGWVTIIEVGRQLALAVLVIVLALGGAGLVVILGASIPVTLAGLLATVVLLRGRVPLVPSFDRTRWMALLRDLLPLSIAVATGVLYFRLSVVIVSLLANAHELSYFGASFRIIEVLTQVPLLMVSAAFPIFARAAHEDHVRFAYGIERVFEVAAIVGVLFVLLLSLGAPIAIAVVGGAEFHPAVEVLRIQAFALGGTFVGAVWSFALLSLRRQRTLMLINLGALAVGSVLVAMLTVLAGANGAASATAVMEIGLAVVGLLVLSHGHAHLRPSLRRLPRILLAGLIAATPALIPGIPTLVLVVVAAALYAGLLFASGAIPDEVMDGLRGRYTGAEAR
jgi:O-antigen/teichoic acid export membrane protein